MKRIFIAIELPEWLRDELERICYGVPGVRWVGFDDFHLTLRFVGSVDMVRLEKIEDTLQGLTSESFTMGLKGVGHFPPRGEPRVVWAGVDAEPGLTTLQRRVDRAMTRIGIEPEHRKWHPHVTLGRLGGAGGSAIIRFLQAHSNLVYEPFLVTSFQLYSSILRPDGAAYTVEGSFPLRA